MAGPLFKDRVQESSITTGTGPYTLGGAVATYQTWSVVGDGNTAYYMVTDGSANWEVALGTYTLSGTTLARTAILASSNSNLAVSWSAGTKTVSLVEPALVFATIYTALMISLAGLSVVAGDILYGSGTAAMARLGVGTLGQGLKVNSSLLPGWASEREFLTAGRSYYVGAQLPTPAISIASPAVVTSTGSNMVAGDPVIFCVAPNSAVATISAANPAVITMANTFVAGQPVVFSSTGSLPEPLVAGTTYYVIAAGLSTSQFEVSATVGGSAISTAAPTATFTNGSANIGIATASTFLKVGQLVRFATSSALPTGFAAATDYYVLSVSTTLITVSATNGGSAITAGSAGTGTQTIVQQGTHYVSQGGALPTGITEGTIYYVIATGLTANAFEVSTSPGGAAVNTSGTVTGSPIYAAVTGNDANNGLTNNRAGAFLSWQHAYDLVASTLDLGGNTVTLQAGGIATWTTGLTMSKSWIGGSIIMDGAGGLISSASADCINASLINPPGTFTVQNFRLTGGGSSLLIHGNVSKITFVIGSGMEFGAAGFAHVGVGYGGLIELVGAYKITGSAPGEHLLADTGAVIIDVASPISLIGVPAFGSFANSTQVDNIDVLGSAFVGSATGSRYTAALNGIVYTGGAGAGYLPGNSAGTTATGGQYF